MSQFSKSWVDFKELINNHQLQWQYNEGDALYKIYGNQGAFTYICTILKEGGLDQIDFENNYKNNSSPFLKIKVLSEPADISLTLYRAPDVVEINAGEEATIDLQLVPESNETQQIIYGGALYAESPGFSDHVKFQIVDVNNILGYGAGLVLKEYIKKAYLNNNNTFEDYDDAGAYLYVGLYLRCIYKSTKDTGSTKVKINYLLGVPG